MRFLPNHPCYSSLRRLAPALVFLSSVVFCRAVDFSPAEAQIFAALKSSPGQKRAQAEIVADPVLTQVARARAQDMANRGYFNHVNPDGCGPDILVERAGYRLPEWWSRARGANFIESISAGNPSASAAWDGWMHSSGHKAHLLATRSFYRNQTRVGIGHVYRNGSRYGHYWVVITAPPSGSSRPSANPARSS